MSCEINEFGIFFFFFGHLSREPARVRCVVFQLELLPPAPAVPMPPPFPPSYPPLPEEEMDMSSEEESEYESGDDEDKER